MILANILIADSEFISPPLSVEMNINSQKSMLADLDYKFYNREEIYSFIKEFYGFRLFNTIQRIKPYAYQVDFARYALIYWYGGVYADLSIFMIKKIKIENRILVFNDFGWASPWDTFNGFFYAPPKHKSLLKCIELVEENVARGYYGNSPLCPTGPTLFGKAIALTCSSEDVDAGRSEYMDIKVDKNEPSRYHSFLKNHELVAFKNKKI